MKRNWDKDILERLNRRVILLGYLGMIIQKELTESLISRLEIILLSLNQQTKQLPLTG